MAGEKCSYGELLAEIIPTTEKLYKFSYLTDVSCPLFKKKPKAPSTCSKSAKFLQQSRSAANGALELTNCRLATVLI